MPIKITRISPPYAGTTPPESEVLAIQAHKTIDIFEWVNEKTQVKNNSTRKILYNWLVNQGGSAYISKGGENIYVFGTTAPTGEHYIRAAKDGVWTNDLLSLSPQKTSTQPV